MTYRLRRCWRSRRVGLALSQSCWPSSSPVSASMGQAIALFSFSHRMGACCNAGPLLMTGWRWLCGMPQIDLAHDICKYLVPNSERSQLVGTQPVFMQASGQGPRSIQQLKQRKGCAMQQLPQSDRVRTLRRGMLQGGARPRRLTSQTPPALSHAATHHLSKAAATTQLAPTAAAPASLTVCAARSSA